VAIARAFRYVAALLLFVLLASIAVLGASGNSPPRSSSILALRAVSLGTLSEAELRLAEQTTAATWCGTPSSLDMKPNVVAGYPVRFVYAVPSDGQERFSIFANVMQTDWETIDSWWRSQDSSRAPRADLARFPCGPQLDLASVRLSQSSAQIAASETPFDHVFDSLDAQGFNSVRTKYVVYYDGPVGDDNVCGVGGTLPGGLGLAVVSVRACVGAASAEVAAHELLHTLGAVPSRAPNNCPPPDDGHTCDNDRDLMYPVTDGTPLTGLTLDPGRDDYYGHSGSWLDIQDAPWLVQLDRQSPLALTVSGSGRVEADVPGLLCSQSCSTTWNAGTGLSLSASASPNAKFVRWGGACTGSSQCLVTVGRAGAVTAIFAPLTYRLSVRVSGKGAVRGASSWILCPGRCVSRNSPRDSAQATPAKVGGSRAGQARVAGSGLCALFDDREHHRAGHLTRV
jgi:hypothetical protein